MGNNLKVMRVLFAALGGFFTPYLILSQSILFVYAEGNTSGSSFTRIEINGKYIGTIGLGENIIYDLENGNNNVRCKNRAYDDNNLEINSVDNNVFVKVNITRKGMKVRQIQEDAIPLIYHDLISKYVSEKEEFMGEMPPSSKVFIDGDIPDYGNTILISIKPNHNCNQVDLDVLTDYLNASLLSNYQLVNRDELNLFIEEQKLSLSGLIQEEKSVKAGNLIGANYTLLSSYQCVQKSNINLTLKLINCETSEIEWVAILNDIQYSKIPEKVSELFSH